MEFNFLGWGGITLGSGSKKVQVHIRPFMEFPFALGFEVWFRNCINECRSCFPCLGPGHYNSVNSFVGPISYSRPIELLDF